MKLVKFEAEHLRDFFIGGAQLLKLNKSAVDALNVFPVPDGDTGTNMSMTVSAAAKEIKNPNSNDIRIVAQELAHGALMGARGNSGVIFSQIIRGMSQGFTMKSATPMMLAKALRKGADLAYNSVMKPVEGTILTVIREMAQAAVQAAHTEADCIEVLESALAHGEKILEQTPSMLLALKQAGVVDAGGKGLIFIFKGGIAALKGEALEIESEVENIVQKHLQESEEYGYCTEFIVKGEKLSLPKAKAALSKLGESLLVVGDEKTLKVHVHTMRPGAVLEYAVSIGTLHDIKIDNMSEQHQENIQEISLKSSAIVAVSAGKGMDDIFSSLGVDIIVEGGQSMNPSTEDLLNAITRAPAQEIILLTNNKNIVPAAEQVKNVTSKKIYLIPTKNMLQGISALTVFDTEKSALLNAAKMEDTYKNITSIEVTYAVRDTVINDLHVSKRDILGLTNGVITIKGTTPEEVMLETLKNNVNKDHEIITIFYGEDIDSKRAEETLEAISLLFPDLEIELHNGGQPIYFYLASLE